jgi:hypothetical protein
VCRKEVKQRAWANKGRQAAMAVAAMEMSRGLGTAFLPIELLLDASVEEKRDMCVLFRLCATCRKSVNVYLNTREEIGSAKNRNCV